MRCYIQYKGPYVWCAPSEPPIITPLATGNAVPSAAPFPMPFAFFPLAGAQLACCPSTSCNLQYQD